MSFASKISSEFFFTLVSVCKFRKEDDKKNMDPITKNKTTKYKIIFFGIKLSLQKEFHAF